MLLSTPIKRFAAFILPCAIWLFIYRDFFVGNVFISEDTYAIFAVVKFFLTNLVHGEFAHWNPYIHWGMAHVCQIGEYSPIWALTLIMNGLGIGFYQAFIFTIVLIYFLTAQGVWSVCRMLIKDEGLSYLGFLFYIFSGVGMAIFVQVTTLLLFLPAIWFFYFLLAFNQEQKDYAVVGMAFCLMLIATTYIPFYFIIVFVSLLLILLIFSPKLVKEFIQKLFGFLLKNPLVFAVSFFGVVIAFGASILNWDYLRSEFIVLARPAVLTYAAVKDSGILISDVIRDPSLFNILILAKGMKMFAHVQEMFDLKDIRFDAQRIFYIPIVAHVMLCAGVVSKINKRIVIWSILSFVLFLMALAKLSIVYQFLFEHVFFFKYFRNIFLLIPYITLAYILLTLELIASLKREIFHERPVIKWASLVLVFFYAFFIFLSPNSIWTSKFAVVMSLIGIGLLFCAHYSDLLVKIGIGLVLVALLLQPLEVLQAHARTFKSTDYPYTIKGAQEVRLNKASFSYLRPSHFDFNMNPNDMYRYYNWNLINSTDAPGFFSYSYGYPTSYAYALSKSSSRGPTFNNYVLHKFAIYDEPHAQVKFSNADDFLRYLEGKVEYQLIESDTAEFKVNKFSVNNIDISLNFKQPKYLVYNDSFHSSFKAYIDHNEVGIDRANYAFKGLSIPAGQHHLKISFEPKASALLYWIILISFYGFFINFIFMWRRQFAQGKL